MSKRCNAYWIFSVDKTHRTFASRHQSGSMSKRCDAGRQFAVSTMNLRLARYPLPSPYSAAIMSGSPQINRYGIAAFPLVTAILPCGNSGLSIGISAVPSGILRDLVEFDHCLLKRTDALRRSNGSIQQRCNASCQCLRCIWRRDKTLRRSSDAYRKSLGASWYFIDN